MHYRFSTPTTILHTWASDGFFPGEAKDFSRRDQGRTAFRWRSGQETSLVPQWFEPKVFRKQMCCIEESTCDIVKTFRRPLRIRQPGHCGPSPTPYGPGGIKTVKLYFSHSKPRKQPFLLKT